MEVQKKKIVLGIVAHVDAGKTTLSEALLYTTGKTRKLGRVDTKDAYLDTYQLERERGITIFSKQAIFEVGETSFALLDTPGHVDFSAEMERTLQVLDYAILVISGTDGIQGHTRTLWHLLQCYQVPTILFVNKMDRLEVEKEKCLEVIQTQLADSCLDFSEGENERLYDQLAMVNESFMDTYLATSVIEHTAIVAAIAKREVFPVFFGSALKLSGIDALVAGLQTYTQAPVYQTTFGAKIFKITRDEEGNRLTHLKVTGGTLQARQLLSGHNWEEKVNQIRIYSGEKFTTTPVVGAGEVCAVTGLTQTSAGECLGNEQRLHTPLLAPVLSYRLCLPEEAEPRLLLPKLRLLEEEDPQLRIVWQESLGEIYIQMMGEVQIEVLQSVIQNRFGIAVTMDTGNIIYKETIQNTVEGVGHFEPLRHYAEVHLLLEPGEEGSGIVIRMDGSEDLLEKNWQRLIASHVEEKMHKGVLTGSPITDIKITVVGGRAHKKHTEGGDFREATYRAIRQGLMEADSILLEPYYAFRLEIPEQMIGRAMTDIEKLHGSSTLETSKDGWAVLTGTGPVVNLRNYQQEVTTYTKGTGKFSCSLIGYRPCHNTETVIASIGYDVSLDRENPTGSVFCAHGAGYLVPWDEVKQVMHVPSCMKKISPAANAAPLAPNPSSAQERSIGLEEIDAILRHAGGGNRGEKSMWKKSPSAVADYYRRSNSYGRNGIDVKKEQYLLVDGYNIIFAWDNLSALAKVTLDGARDKLLEILSNYQAIKGATILVVFDAYRVAGNIAEVQAYHNIYQVFTKEAQTADHYIEKFVHEHSEKYAVTVATSDGLEQMIIRGKGCALLSARELKLEVAFANKTLLETYYEQQTIEKNYLEEILPSAIKEILE